MAMGSLRARDFWRQMEIMNQKNIDEPDYFKRGSNFRSSSGPMNSLNTYTNNSTMWGSSIYCTIRDRSKGGARSASASTSYRRGDIKNLRPPRSTSASERSTPSPGPVHHTKMQENGIVISSKLGEVKQSSPKRYETTCYFMPLAVPVWYSTSVSLKINSTKRHYKETVNYQKKLMPYRFVETMTTVTSGTNPPVVYVSELDIERKLAPKEHYIDLEPQQQQEKLLDSPFSTNHHIEIENHT